MGGLRTWIACAVAIAAATCWGFEPMESSVFQGVKYDTAQKVLVVKARDGRVLSFRNVPSDVYEGFKDASQPGGYFKANVANAFPTVRGDLLAEDMPASDPTPQQTVPKTMPTSNTAPPPMGGRTHAEVWGDGGGESYNFAIGGQLEYLLLDDEAATREGVGDDGFAFGIFGEYRPATHVGLSLGFGGVFLDDQEQFEQQVLIENVFDDDEISTESSDVFGFYGVAEVTGWLPLGAEDTVQLGGAVGYKYISVDREISNCRNCREEDVDLDGGVYLSPQVLLNFPHVAVSLGYEFFLSGDVEGIVAGNVAYTVGW